MDIECIIYETAGTLPHRFIIQSTMYITKQSDVVFHIKCHLILIIPNVMLEHQWVLPRSYRLQFGLLHFKSEIKYTHKNISQSSSQRCWAIRGYIRSMEIHRKLHVV